MPRTTKSYFNVVPIAHKVAIDRFWKFSHLIAKDALLGTQSKCFTPH